MSSVIQTSQVMVLMGSNCSLL